MSTATSTPLARPRRFAPLNPELSGERGWKVARESESGSEAVEVQELEGVIFDVDGTLCCEYCGFGEALLWKWLGFCQKGHCYL